MAGRQKKSLTLHLVSLGCSKNLVDSERLLGAAVGDFNFRLVDEPEEADLLIINTCAFIKAATVEAISTILELRARQKSGGHLAVMGCLVSRYKDDLKKNLPEASFFLGPGEYDQFPQKLSSILNLPLPQFASFENWTRLRSTPPWRAWLKVAEGCNHKCAYCLIPSIRGSLVVRDLLQLVEEASLLVAGGCLELTLVAQDLTAWEKDGKDLFDLLQALSEIPGLIWLRLMYAYPERLTEKLVRSLAELPKVVPYLDVPFQHASPFVLKAMGRKAVNPALLVARLRKWWPSLALRTTLMVGFPGETEKDFDLLVRLVEEACFESLGVFRFSAEEGAKAAGFSDQVPARIKEKRFRALMSRQKRISLSLNQKRLGHKFSVLVEGPSEDSPLVMTGRAYFQAPEVDGLIYFDGRQPESGQMEEALIVKAGVYDLIARLPDEY